ncbi:MAG: hypothetical protein WC662_04995 [Candidatus Paceibacterota bacterium]|jgi:hypothetical protein
MKKLLIALFSVIGVIALVIIIITIVNSNSSTTSPPPDDKENLKGGTIPPTFAPGTLEPKNEAMVGPNKAWETPPVNYKYKIRTDGHAYGVQWTSTNGGWTKKIDFPAEGDFEAGKDFTKPSDAKKGAPLRITFGKGEKKEYKVQLYKVH